ncbi:hypothetical protein EVAR_27026_1 [Eumeta japonica]|uniref:Uncharacterized protein n=1 Tax=Eumeta variegata TaxID=151549 RepID=A0A4C1WGQ8_EUMVA|nr:hypothetical protein EVAR_27026_1 [Eumeta japonica]
MVVLQKAIQKVKNDKDGLVNIFSDSRSSLEVSTSPETYHPLAHPTRRDIFENVAEGKAYFGLEPFLKQFEMMSQITQTLTGHVEFPHYLFRFKLKDSPYCVCDPAKEQDVPHTAFARSKYARERVYMLIEIDNGVGRQLEK